MTATPPTSAAESTLVDARILFADPLRHPGRCCDCCGGYCPRSEISEDEYSWRRVWEATIDGVLCLTDRYSMVRRDALVQVPSLFRGRMSATHMDRLDRAGLTARVGTNTVCHLYLVESDVHVGWTSVAASGGITRRDLTVVRAIAEETGLGVGAAAKALHIAKGGDV